MIGEHVTTGSLLEDGRMTRQYLAQAFQRAGFTDRDKLEPDKLNVLINRRDREWVFCYKNLILLKKKLVRGIVAYEVQYEMPIGERLEENEVKVFEERKFSPSEDPFNQPDPVG